MAKQGKVKKILDLEGPTARAGERQKKKLEDQKHAKECSASKAAAQLVL